MKRFLVSLLMPLVLLFANTGVAFHIHYCSGEIASFDAVYYGNHTHDEQGCCEGEETMACCSDDIIETADQKLDWAKSYDFSWVALPVSLDYSADIAQIDLAQLPKQAKPRGAIPPNLPLFQLYSQYLVYA